MRRRTLWLVILLAGAAAAGLLVVQAQDDGPPAWATCSAPSAHSVPDAAATEPPVDVGLESVAEVEQPTAAAALLDGSLLVTLKEQGVVAIDPEGTVTPVLDLTADLSFASEQGVLGIAVQPGDTAAFVAYTAADGAFTLERIALPIAEPLRREVILEYPDEHRFHNGGGLVFGPDGMLYVSLGDGGDENYEGDPEDDAQSLGSLFGKILRLDVSSDPGTYVVPADNPFADVADARPEVFMYGMRNPWRFTFDQETGDLWVADVGHFCWEEVNRIASGEGGSNLGWNRFEGGYDFRPTDPEPEPLTWPLFQYRHVPGPEGAEVEGDRAFCAIVGGGVYRGAGLAPLDGWYIYSDFCARAVFALGPAAGDRMEVATLAESSFPVLSLATDGDGEILVLTTTNVMRVVPSDPG